MQDAKQDDYIRRVSLGTSFRGHLPQLNAALLRLRRAQGPSSGPVFMSEAECAAAEAHNYDTLPPVRACAEYLSRLVPWTDAAGASGAAPGAVSPRPMPPSTAMLPDAEAVTAALRFEPGDGDVGAADADALLDSVTAGVRKGGNGGAGDAGAAVDATDAVEPEPRAPPTAGASLPVDAKIALAEQELAWRALVKAASAEPDTAPRAAAVLHLSLVACVRAGVTEVHHPTAAQAAALLTAATAVPKGGREAKGKSPTTRAHAALAITALATLVQLGKSAAMFAELLQKFEYPARLAQDVVSYGGDPDGPQSRSIAKGADERTDTCGVFLLTLAALMQSVPAVAAAPGVADPTFLKQLQPIYSRPGSQWFLAEHAIRVLRHSLAVLPSLPPARRSGLAKWVEKDADNRTKSFTCSGLLNTATMPRRRDASKWAMTRVLACHALFDMVQPKRFEQFKIHVTASEVVQETSRDLISKTSAKQHAPDAEVEAAMAAAGMPTPFEALWQTHASLEARAKAGVHGLSAEQTAAAVRVQSVVRGQLTRVSIKEAKRYEALRTDVLTHMEVIFNSLLPPSERGSEETIPTVWELVQQLTRGASWDDDLARTSRLRQHSVDTIEKPSSPFASPVRPVTPPRDELLSAQRFAWETLDNEQFFGDEEVTVFALASLGLALSMSVSRRRFSESTLHDHSHPSASALLRALGQFPQEPAVVAYSSIALAACAHSPRMAPQALEAVRSSEWAAAVGMMTQFFGDEPAVQTALLLALASLLNADPSFAIDLLDAGFPTEVVIQPLTMEYATAYIVESGVRVLRFLVDRSITEGGKEFVQEQAMSAMQSDESSAASLLLDTCTAGQTDVIRLLACATLLLLVPENQVGPLGVADVAHKIVCSTGRNLELVERDPTVPEDFKRNVAYLVQLVDTGPPELGVVVGERERTGSRGSHHKRPQSSSTFATIDEHEEEAAAAVRIQALARGSSSRRVLSEQLANKSTTSGASGTSSPRDRLRIRATRRSATSTVSSALGSPAGKSPTADDPGLASGDFSMDGAPRVLGHDAERAAIHIQTAARGHLARRRVADLRLRRPAPAEGPAHGVTPQPSYAASTAPLTPEDAAVKVQAVARSHLARRHITVAQAEGKPLWKYFAELGAHDRDVRSPRTLNDQGGWAGADEADEHDLSDAERHDRAARVAGDEWLRLDGDPGLQPGALGYAVHCYIQGQYGNLSLTPSRRHPGFATLCFAEGGYQSSRAELTVNILDFVRSLDSTRDRENNRRTGVSQRWNRRLKKLAKRLVLTEQVRGVRGMRMRKRKSASGSKSPRRDSNPASAAPPAAGVRASTAPAGATRGRTVSHEEDTDALLPFVPAGQPSRREKPLTSAAAEAASRRGNRAAKTLPRIGSRPLDQSTTPEYSRPAHLDPTRRVPNRPVMRREVDANEPKWGSPSPQMQQSHDAARKRPTGKPSFFQSLEGLAVAPPRATSYSMTPERIDEAIRAGKQERAKKAARKHRGHRVEVGSRSSFSNSGFAAPAARSPQWDTERGSEIAPYPGAFEFEDYGGGDFVRGEPPRPKTSPLRMRRNDGQDEDARPPTAVSAVTQGDQTSPRLYGNDEEERLLEEALAFTAPVAPRSRRSRRRGRSKRRRRSTSPRVSASRASTMQQFGGVPLGDGLRRPAHAATNPYDAENAALERIARRSASPGRSPTSSRSRSPPRSPPPSRTPAATPQEQQRREKLCFQQEQGGQRAGPASPKDGRRVEAGSSKRTAAAAVPVPPSAAPRARQSPRVTNSRASTTGREQARGCSRGRQQSRSPRGRSATAVDLLDDGAQLSPAEKAAAAPPSNLTKLELDKAGRARAADFSMLLQADLARVRGALGKATS